MKKILIGIGGRKIFVNYTKFRLAAIFPRNFTKFGKFRGGLPPPSPRKLRPCTRIAVYPKMTRLVHERSIHCSSAYMD